MVKSHKIAASDDLQQIMDVINDVPISEQEKSRKIIEERIFQGQILCALGGDKIVGFVGWNKNFNSNPAFAYLEQITIKKEFRGRGIGQNLLKSFTNLCKENRMEKIFAHVQNHNKVSLNMFLGSGWVVNNEQNFVVKDETFLEYNIEKFEFWFRKEYEDLVREKKLTQFVRPGVRKVPDPKGTQLGEKVWVRIVEVPSLVKEEAVLNPLILNAEVIKLEPKKISDMTDDDFVGTSLDSNSQEGVLAQLERIYNKKFTKDDVVTVFKIKYE